MYGISEHAYAQALVVELHRAGIDARITDNGDHKWSNPTLLIEKDPELVIRDDHGDLPWSRFHTAGESAVVLDSTGHLHGLGPVTPTDHGLERVVNAVKEILQ